MYLCWFTIHRKRVTLKCHVLFPLFLAVCEKLKTKKTFFEFFWQLKNMLIVMNRALPDLDGNFFDGNRMLMLFLEVFRSKMLILSLVDHWNPWGSQEPVETEENRLLLDVKRFKRTKFNLINWIRSTWDGRTVDFYRYVMSF